MIIKDNITLFEYSDTSWPFSSTPNFYIKPKSDKYGRAVNVDPFPCYSHPLEFVHTLAKNIEGKFKIGFEVSWYILPNDADDRTNGFASYHGVWDDKLKIGESNAFDPFIVLFGKRIPLMPSMTRYLVAHEYGHQVQNWIEYKMGLSDSSDKFDKEYAKIRGIECDKSYGGLKWHKNIGEIIANDFRIIIGQAEREFWPHDCIHPLKDKNIIKFWKHLKKEYNGK